MTLSDLLNKAEEAGFIEILNDKGRGAVDDIDTWLHAQGIDSETPIPVWNEEAQAWEV